MAFKMKKVKTETIEVNSYVCDLCGNEDGYRRVCHICKKDVCKKCTEYDPRDSGDYPTIYCKECFKVGQKYLEQIESEQLKLDNLIEDLEKKWKEEALDETKKEDVNVENLILETAQNVIFECMRINTLAEGGDGDCGIVSKKYKSLADAFEVYEKNSAARKIFIERHDHDGVIFFNCGQEAVWFAESEEKLLGACPFIISYFVLRTEFPF